MTVGLWIHIPAGVAGLLSGAAAFYFRKGSKLHNLAGRVFVWSMMIMTLSGALLGYLYNELDSLLVGLITFYLVVTAWVTSIRKGKKPGLIEYTALLYALTLGCSAWILARNMDSIEAQPIYFIGTIALFLAAGDAYTIIRRNRSGMQRIARHLWRMGFAYFITVLSIFVGQPELYPESIRETHLLNVPVYFVIALILFWLVRVYSSKKFKQANGDIPSNQRNQKL